MDVEELTRTADLSKIAKEGTAIYESIKDQYEPAHRGEFLAIEIESQNVYLAETSAEAMAQARKAHPNKVFFVLKIGFDAADAIAHLFPKK